MAQWEALLPLFPPGARPGEADVRDPVAGLERLSPRWPGRLRLLPYRAVGVERGLLLAVRLDWVQGREGLRRGVLAALSPTPVSENETYQALAGSAR